MTMYVLVGAIIGAVVGHIVPPGYFFWFIIGGISGYALQLSNGKKW